ncbi:Sorting nexin-41 [Grifola frondosa]|uniref:Sorting nexin-41 n=1 Tax=Grifola frondosa TaxID=5627 RepID=A0A1C7LQL4_GRIFR|nr:Sorting nexin-41 [Grifola frondosa]
MYCSRRVGHVSHVVNALSAARLSRVSPVPSLPCHYNLPAVLHKYFNPISPMEPFEDENPFETEPDRLQSDTSSTSKVNLSEPSSPPIRPSRVISPPSSPSAQRPTFPSSGSHRQPQVFKSDYCCTRDQWLHSGEDVEILITDALKTTANSSSPYITYVIQSRGMHFTLSYSEFESLRSNLVKLYPTIIIPPIPSKQSIGEYAVKQAKAKEDAAMIARRKRMLQTFLNRIARHPILSNEHVFHRFLDGEVSWAEVLHSPPLSLLPKNILKAPSHSPTDQNASLAYAALPNPSPAHPLRRPDQRFLDSEVFTNKFAAHLGGPMEKGHSMEADFSQDHSELGATLNGFSLNETGQLSTAIEKTGQAIDTSYMSTTKLLQEFEQNWAEPLYEYTQFASIIKKLLVYRHQKHVQYEMTQDALEAKREQLEELEKSEREARRLEEALSQGHTSNSRSVSGQGEDEAVGGEAREETQEPQHDSSVYLPPHPGPSPVKRRAPGMGLLSALSYTLHGMMDVDPESARRNGISKTRETISQAWLEDALHLSAQDLKYSSSTIQADLDRFQRQKVADLREMTISMARSHRDWCKKNLEAWEEAKLEIAKIPDHPNRIPDDKTNGGVGRRDSVATVNGR